METEADPEYLYFLSNLRLRDNSYEFEIQPDGASSPVRVTYDEINPTRGMKPSCKSKIIRRDLSAIEESGGGKPGLERDSVRSGKKRRKYNKDEGLSERKLVFQGSSGKIYDSRCFNYSTPEKASKMNLSVEISDELIASERENASFEEERENPVRKDASVDERPEIQSQQASPLPELITTHFQGFALLLKTLCPIETTIYPGWNDGNEGVIKPTAEPAISQSMDFDWIEEKREVEANSRHKGNKRGNVEIETKATFHELSDWDEEPIMDAIPVEVLSRPPSGYKDRLIRELKRPFDKCEYRELMNKAVFRNKKIVYKELRSVEKAVETKSALRFRERAIKTEEDSKSLFNYYPEVEMKIRRASIGRRLTLLRGFFFWLQNCAWEESFKPWQKCRKRSKKDLRNDSVAPK